MLFTKILVAEDTDSNKKGVVDTLIELSVPTVHQSQFCDDAFLKIKKASLDGTPYQLLISDYHFTPSHGRNNITSGKELISKVKEVQPDIKVIVFSVEDKQPIIKFLLDELKIDGYVCKGLYGLKELTKALYSVSKDQIYTCPVSSTILQQKNVLKLDAYDKQLLRLLADGLKQSEISDYFKSKNITPNSIRSIEGHISKLKDEFNATTPAQLIYIANSLGLI